MKNSGMYKYSLIITLFHLVAFSSLAQAQVNTPAGTSESEVVDSVSTTQPIEIRKKIFTAFYQNGEKLSTSLLRDVVVRSPEAVLEMQQARKNYLASVVLNTVGSFAITYPIASSVLSGSKLNWKLASVGVAMVGVGLPLSRAYIRHAENAARIHNQRVGKTTGYKTNLQIGFVATGAGIKFTF